MYEMSLSLRIVAYRRSARQAGCYIFNYPRSQGDEGELKGCYENYPEGCKMVSFHSHGWGVAFPGHRKSHLPSAFYQISV